MKGWSEIELGSVADYGKEKIEATLIDSVNYISTDNMLTDKHGICESEYVPKEGKVSKYVDNDILVSNIRPYFKKIWFADRTGGCSNDVIVFKTDKNKIDPKFLFYQLSKDEFFDFMMSGSNGVKMPRGNKNSIPQFKFLSPPLPIQLKIASTLSAYDNLIANNLRRIKLLEDEAQIIFNEWFVNSDGLSKGCIGDLVDFQNGFAFKSEKFVQAGLPIIKIKNIDQNAVDIMNTDFVDEEYAQQASRFKLDEGDLLIAMTGATVGKVGYMPFSNKDCFLNQRVGRFIKKGKTDNRHFVFCSIGCPHGQQQVINIASGAAQPNISGDQILSIECVLPDESQLIKFYNQINPVIKLSLNLRYQNRLLRETKDILLPRLMSGIIKIKDEELETA